MSDLYWRAACIMIPMGLLVAVVMACSSRRPITESTMPATEREALEAIRALGINVSTSDSFSIDFRTRARAILSRDSQDKHSHLIGFEVLPSCASPFSTTQLQNLVSDSVQHRLVRELVKCQYLQRAILPDFSKASMARLRRELPDCLVSASLADAQSESAKVIKDAHNRFR